MYQFFVDNSQILGEKIAICGDDYNHIANVLRMKAGEKVRISDEDGRSYLCTIDSFDTDTVYAMILEYDGLGTELNHKIYLFQGLPKGDKMETVIQKSVELGVYEVIPVAMKRCVMKLDAKRAENKIRRWNAIAESAAKQAKRTIVPKVTEQMTYQQALEMARELDVVLVPYENERGMDYTRETIRNIKPEQSIGIFIGPEGGFADDEIAKLDADMHKISLGRRILRTETAGLATLAMLIYELDT
ncbi:MAG: 16S rRNA (uracil(1498)-N(3))-methyltransferase [Agathobacter sp.]|uniref:16S rRNA (uracil(1498)-N(3))-methyltransferase n=1 Tax=Agathobacter sp. TaxID=2021311 RepID=UPI002583CFAC|nr:16S rRNA (uracil(1498)-N(3))-methyltransferase [Agathobacter sp.]MCR5678421.1 16S rRNA (uracil(1498)-N(3))-methyltransferase [Agathobacter sp.]